MLKKAFLTLLSLMLLINLFIKVSGCSRQEVSQTLETAIEEQSISLDSYSDIDKLIRKAEGKRLVLLGESTHGTLEFYKWRAEISRRLIEEAGFNFIVVEGDWYPACQVNRFVKGFYLKETSPEELLLQNFTRWPQWMWANPVIKDLVVWLKEYNEDRTWEELAGFYGMDVYGHWESMRAVKEYIRYAGSEKLMEVKSNYDCFAKYNYDEWVYAQAVHAGSQPCEEKVEEVLALLMEKGPTLSPGAPYNYFSAKQNAIVVRNAELYYRTASGGGSEGWNNRVLHMKDAINRLLDFYGEDSRGIVWAHNTHIGDARATTMAARGELNIGQLARERYGMEDVYIVGFGTHRGYARAGRRWGFPGEEMSVPPGREGSVEDLFHRVSYPVFLINIGETSIEELRKPLMHRAIGVIYNPLRETGNYVPTILPLRYDSFIFIEETRAISQLEE